MSYQINEFPRAIVAKFLRDAGFEVQLVNWPNNVNENNGLGEWSCKSRAVDQDTDVIKFFNTHHTGCKIYLLDVVDVNMLGWSYKIRYDVR